MRRIGSFLLALFVAAMTPVTAGADPASCTPATPGWHETKAEDVFRMPQGLLRSQGVTTDGSGWIFSWQGGLERTNDAYVEQAAAPWPADIVVNNPTVTPDGKNHLLNTHFGDIDYYAGKIYAPYEDGGEGPLNDPDYQHPYIAVYDAQTLLYTGEHYALDVNIHAAGVPWVAINAKKQLAYTGEWDMPNDRLNVYDLGFHFKRFLTLHYPAELGTGFHLSRIQGLKVDKNVAYATRDDDGKSVFKIDLKTGDVTKLFSINPPAHTELEGLAIRDTPDGAHLHVLLVRDNNTSDPKALSNIRVTFLHFAPNGCDEAPAPAPSDVPPVTTTHPCTAVGCDDDFNYANALENKVAENMWFGQVFEIDKDPTTGATTSVNHFGDSALWTGTYLAAESYRYALASKYKHDHSLTPEDRSLWSAERVQAKSRIDAMVAKFHMLANISKNWTNENGPTIAPPAINHGGAVYAGGEAGNLMRACVPTTAPEWQRWSNNEIAHSRRIYGPLIWDDGKTYYCEDGTSRDAYAGTFFGLLTAFDLVGPSDKKIADTLRDDMATMTGFAAKYYWNIPRPNGRISIPIGSNHDGTPCTSINPTLDICGHDFENFFSPLFIITPAARLNMAAATWHAVHADPGRSDVTTWDALHAEEIATQLPSLAAEMEIDDFQPNSSYYKFNLNHLLMFDLTRIETDPVSNLAVRQAFGVMDSTTRDDINAHFESLTYALTGETSRLNDAALHLRQWRDYFARIHTTPTTNNSQFCGTSITCVPDDQMEEDLSGQTVLVPGMSTKLRAKDPIPVANRPPTDFLWQRPPWQLDGAESINHQTPGIDYLLPYWLLRYTTEAAHPAVTPFPAWPGPVHN